MFDHGAIIWTGEKVFVMSETQVGGALLEKLKHSEVMFPPGSRYWRILIGVA